MNKSPISITIDGAEYSTHMLKSQINPIPPVTPKIPPFPKMMRSVINKDKIVLFSSEKKGMVVSGCVAHVSDNWDMCWFEDVPAGFSVTITQE